MYILWLDQIKEDHFNLVGGKGFNLGTMTKLGLPVPEGFAITTKAFDDFIRLTGIRDKIHEILSATNVEDTKQLLKASEEIKSLITSQEIPEKIKAAIVEAYTSLSFSDKIIDERLRKLIAAGREFAIVAVRSSATSEDLPSVAEDEYVLLKIGEEIVFDKMKNLWERINGQPIFVPSLVENKVKWCKVQEIYKHKVNGYLVKITTKSGRELLLTPNHSLVVLDVDNLKPKPASIFDLNKNTRVPVVFRLPIEDKPVEYVNLLEMLKGEDIVEENGRVKTRQKPKQQIGLPRKIKIDEDFAYFLGIYAAKGSIHKNCVDLSCESAKIVNKIKEYLKRIGVAYIKRERKNVRIFNATLAKFLLKLFGKPSDTKGKGRFAKVKKVPQLIFNQNRRIIASFLRGCFDGDGYVGDYICYSSISKDLIAGIVTLLEFLGIKCYINKRKNCFEIIIPQDETENFLRTIGMSERKKVKRIEKIISEYKKRKKHYDFVDNFPPSNKISSLIENTIREKYKRLIEVYVCPICNGKMIKNGKSSSRKQRFICVDCGKSISYTPKKTITETLEVMDEKGRFLKGSPPWNIGKLRPQTMDRKMLKRIAEAIGCEELIKIAETDVIWDKVERIERVPYKGYVFDFVVPETENFLAGAGGIITHNTASFAGQQASFLNVKGVKELLEKVKECWASLYEPRAIFYRAKSNIPHASISVIVQRMVNSDKSGVMFTKDPVTGEDNIVIEACWGLGETLVQGEVEPDLYVVSKDGKIISKKIGKKTIKRIRDFASDTTVVVPVPKEFEEAQVLTEDEILQLSHFGKILEKHYGRAQDVEFAIERNKIYLVQTRAVTTEVKKEETKITGEPILRGLGSSPGVAVGRVRIIKSLKDIEKVEKGDILVTKMTSPDLVPTMSKCSAIITDEGGMNCHASIVAREMGIPCIVGTKNATLVLKDGEVVTVDAYHGLVYPGKVAVEKVEEAPTISLQTVTKVKVNLAFATENLEKIAEKADGVGLLRIEHMIAKYGIHPAKLIKEGRKEEYIRILLDGIRPIAKAFKDKPVWVRTLDARTDEFRNLKGGEEEPVEANPMLGWHGIRRSLDEPELLKAEFEAIKRLHEEGLTNVHIMLPFVISVEEFEKARKIANEIELPLTVKIGIMVETVGAALTIEEFCKAGISFVSIGSNDLTMLALGVDRNNARISGLYSEFHPAVLRMMKEVIETCNKYDVESSICGESGSNPEMVKRLVKFGISSVSCNIDAIDKVRKAVAEAERELIIELKKKRSH